MAPSPHLSDKTFTPMLLSFASMLPWLFLDFPSVATCYMGSGMNLLTFLVSLAVKGLVKASAAGA